VTCGAGSLGAQILYSCPAPVPTAACVFWDEAARRWAGEGCVVAAVNASSVTCACTHFTEFAARFAALGAAQRDVFAETLALGDPRIFTQSPHVWAALGVLAGFLLLGAAITGEEDQRGARRFYAALAADEEVSFLARIEAAKGHAFVLDRELDGVIAAEATLAAAEGKIWMPEPPGTRPTIAASIARAAAASLARCRCARCGRGKEGGNGGGADDGGAASASARGKGSLSSKLPPLHKSSTYAREEADPVVIASPLAQFRAGGAASAARASEAGRGSVAGSRRTLGTAASATAMPPLLGFSGRVSATGTLIRPSAPTSVVGGAVNPLWGGAAGGAAGGGAYPSYPLNEGSRAGGFASLRRGSDAPSVVSDADPGDGPSRITATPLGRAGA
jgi:hypothetical protein